MKATECSYTSVEILRRDIQIRSSGELTSKLRDSIFVGCINRRRCMLQSGADLILVDYCKLAEELFFQLSLLQFGGFKSADFRNEGVNVMELIKVFLRDDNTSSTCAETCSQPDSEYDKFIREQARKATECLTGHMEMLMEYFTKTEYTVFWM